MAKKKRRVKKRRIEYRPSLRERMEDFHPLRDYLDALPEWDGVKRVESLFIKYLKADDSEYVRAVTRKTFAAAVARIYAPGTKFDCVPVLDGDQGIDGAFLSGERGEPFGSQSITSRKYRMNYNI